MICVLGRVDTLIKMSSHDIIVITTPNGNCNLPLNDIIDLIKQNGKDGLGFYYKEPN